ncbi:hypothetical protein C8J57DRAFT_1300692 [Mycena rebaudengoi]|nr:hypothetical protein C8J57DRAFT_1300692 [Mycena rebaudengoi]
MKYASRKYIDLVQAVSSKWANWDPPHIITVGDYGTLDKATGRFEKDGNIYTDPSTAEIAAAHLPQVAAPDEDMIISSETAQKHDLSFGPQVNVAGLAEASIKGTWTFKSGKTGALLVMSRPHSSFVPPNTLLKKLLDVPLLADKYLVTEVIACHAYGMYLSSSTEDNISLALVASTPIPAAPLVSAGGEVGVSWLSESGSGLFRRGCAPPDTECYTPLFGLKRIRKKSIFYRDEPPAPREGDDLWEDVESPWDPLDEDGEEESFEDTVFD